MIKGKIDRRKRAASRYYHQPSYWDTVVRTILLKGKTFKVDGYTLTFFVTHIYLIKTFRRDYTFAVFFDHNTRYDTSANMEEEVRKYFRKIVYTYLNEHVMTVTAYDGYRKNHLVSCWEENIQIDILKHWNGYTGICQ
jgi:hypothetical protein